MSEYDFEMVKRIQSSPALTKQFGMRHPIILAGMANAAGSEVSLIPNYTVDKLHKAGIMVANIVGHPKHVKKAIEAGVDFIIAQGGEGGGHSGDVSFSVLIPTVIDVV